MNILITTFDGDETETLVSFNMGKSVPTKFWSGEHELAKSWSRFKVRDRASFDKAASKWFPNFIEIESPSQDLRLLINGFIDAGHSVCVAEIDDDNRISIHGAVRENEDGERINRDGVPMSECDLDGVPYPKAPEGQRRYRITVCYGGGASYCDYHKMWFGATPRDAALSCVDYLQNDPEALRIPEIFRSGGIGQIHAVDIETEQTFFFNGADCGQSADSKMLESLFNHAVRSMSGEPVDETSEAAQLFASMNPFQR